MLNCSANAAPSQAKNHRRSVRPSAGHPFTLRQLRRLCPVSPPPVLRRIQLYLRMVIDERGVTAPRWLAVLAAILGHASSDDPDGFCWPGSNRLATLVGCLPSVVRAARRSLVERGVLRRDARSVPIRIGGRQVIRPREGYLIDGWDDVYDETLDTSRPSDIKQRAQNSKLETNVLLFSRRAVGATRHSIAQANVKIVAEADRLLKQTAGVPLQDRVLIDVSVDLGVDPPMIRRMLREPQRDTDWVQQQAKNARTKKNPAGYFVNAFFKGFPAISDGAVYARYQLRRAIDVGPTRCTDESMSIRSRLLLLCIDDQERVRRLVKQRFPEGTPVGLAFRRNRADDAVWGAVQRAMTDLQLD
jgi:hypothetical protein